MKHRRCSMPHCEEEATIPLGMLSYCSDCTVIVCENLAEIREKSVRRPLTDAELRRHAAWLSQNQAFIKLEREDPRWRAKQERSAKLIRRIATEFMPGPRG